MRFLYLFLLLCLGCHTRDQVDVTGAVHTPGTYDYVAEWKVADYVLAAGGYTPEAVIDQTHLVRDTSDVSGKDDLEPLIFHLNDQPEVLPQDKIVVPARVYPVSLDTVHLVQNVSLEVGDEIFRMERGALVAGRTERGVVVAMLMGSGQIFELPDTNDAISVFHYLFVHLHPKEYKRITGFAEGVVDSLEALEDAQAIFQQVFPLRDYQVAMQAELPPVGSFVAIPGMWARPKLGEGVQAWMRKRRFRDGRIWTTFPDGRHRWQFPDGRVEVTFVDGKKETRFPDGQVVISDVKGNKTTPNDRLERAGDRQGDHKRVTERLDNGDFFVREVDGTERLVRTDGSVMVLHPDGRMVTQKADGSVVMLFPDGRKEFHSKSGDVTQVFPGGRREIKTRDGHRGKEFEDGRKVWAREDGASLIEYPNGHRIQRWPDGQAVESFADGRLIRTSPFGHRMEVFPDGRRRLTMPEDYDYPGEVRQSLIQIEETGERVEHVDVGDEWVVNGRLLAPVDYIRVAAFMVPDGAVIEGDLQKKEDTFSARFRFKEDGHCCIQIQVVLPGARTTTVFHQMVEVGEVVPLEAVTFELADYPGDEKADVYLIDEINRARKKVGQPPVFPHPELMAVARIRLEEMIALGEVSHYSAEGKDVMWHVNRRQVPFRQVGENVANGQVLEVLHPHWMSSAGHRGNVLNKDWTHVGTAATQFRNGVWAVEVFGR